VLSVVNKSIFVRQLPRGVSDRRRRPIAGRKLLEEMMRRHR
jgi:hypothetical protein